MSDGPDRDRAMLRPDAQGGGGARAADGPTIAQQLAAAEPSAPRPLGELLDRLVATEGLSGVRVGGRAVPPDAVRDVLVAHPDQDSRRTKPGDLFVAVPGEHVDGHDYLASAWAAGATAAIVERPVAEVDVPQVLVPSSRAALARAASWWYQEPSHRLGVIGVTGTDGKTTTSFLAAAALEAAGLRAGLVGTVALRIGGVREPTPEHSTTPQAPELQALLHAMATTGDDAAIIETTSHGLALDRVLGVEYDVALFTNLTHEHLELHGSFEAYRAAKLRLFEMLGRSDGPKHGPGGRTWPRVGIVNRDDPSAPWFSSATLAAGARLITYGTDLEAEVRAVGVEEDLQHLWLSYEAPSGHGRVGLRLAGRFNVHNALAVVALGEALGLEPGIVRTGLASVPAVPGRMERVDLGQPFGVVVDYAHSPASLATVLDLLAPLAAARGGGLIVVFGSAGERDRAKRPMMGRVAGERCRLVVVTDEDPRGEDREAILEEIAEGAEAAGRRRDHDLLCIADRRAAIGAAFDRARDGDIVLLAGKGHERTIEYADGPLPWDERGVAEAILRERIPPGS
jgi:UDP-N-acetylmuramoyl-L-alanyl-D-glutamate--2,6-diaminopimelate ligase